MKSYALAGILVATLTGAPAFTPTAAAQVATSGSFLIDAPSQEAERLKVSP